MIGQDEIKCHTGRSNTKHLKQVLAVLMAGAFAGISNDAAIADDSERFDYVLTHVAVGVKEGQRFKSPIELEADADGGIILSNFKAPPDCSEKVTYKWRFNKDIRYIRSGETFTVDLQVITSDCAGNKSGPMAEAFGLGSSRPTSKVYPGLTTAENSELAERDGMLMLTKDAKIWGKRAKNQNRRVGQGTVEFKANPGPSSNKRPWFTLLFSGESRKGDGRLNDDFLEVRVAYIYKRLDPAETTGDVEIVLDNPGSNSNTTISILGEQAGSATTGSDMIPGDDADDDPSRNAGDRGQSVDDDCLDPKVQDCIDQWIAIATRLRNETQSDLGPWRISQYGQWLNRIITNVQPPDGWNTKYHESRYCVTWIEAVHEHEQVAYRGELPALRDFVRDCLLGNSSIITINMPDHAGNNHAGPNVSGHGDWGPRGDNDSDWGHHQSVGDGRLGNLNLTINYPTDKLQLVDSAVGQVESSTLLQMNAEPPGVIRIGLADQKGAAGEYTLCRLDFRLRGNPGDAIAVTGDVTLANRTDNARVHFMVHEGIIRVLGESVRGDFNGDGNITSLDALAALRMSIGSLPVQMIMNVDGDGQVTAKDARLIMDLAINAPPTNPQSLFGNWNECEPNRPPSIMGPAIVIGSASKASGEVVSIPVMLYYQ